MAVPALAAAKRLCERSGWSLTNLELQKLLYIAHMFHLGRTSEPLIREHFEAWDYGPVVPSLYHKAKVFGSSKVGNIFRFAEDLTIGSEAQMLDETYDQLATARPGRLVAITHWDGGAWANHYAPRRLGTLIPNKDILQEYRDREEAAKND